MMIDTYIEQQRKCTVSTPASACENDTPRDNYWTACQVRLGNGSDTATLTSITMPSRPEQALR